MSWFIPSLGYLILVGTIGITIRIAVQHVQWQAVFFWTTFVYAVTVLILWGLGQLELSIAGTGTRFAVISGSLAAASFICLNIALSKGEASKVIPVTSAYPIVTALLAFLFLREGLSMGRVAGIALVVVGLVVVGRAA